MQNQIKQMKSSIANIQHSLERLSCEQAVKDISHENILLEEIIYQEIYSKPIPTPKITCSVPNIVRTQIFSPSRHHLDDTEMKKALRDHCTKSCKSKISNGRQKSLTVKTKYVYDGSRVVYAPPPVEPVQEYGHLVIKTQRKNEQQRNKKSKPMSLVGVKAYESFDGQRVESEGGIKIQNYAKKSKRINDYEYELRSKRNHQQKPRSTIPIHNYQQHSQKTKKNGHFKQKSVKVQCNIATKKFKPFFRVSRDHHTDSQFSDLQL